MINMTGAAMCAKPVKPVIIPSVDIPRGLQLTPWMRKRKTAATTRTLRKVTVSFVSVRSGIMSVIRSQSTSTPNPGYVGRIKVKTANSAAIII